MFSQPNPLRVENTWHQSGFKASESANRQRTVGYRLASRTIGPEFFSRIQGRLGAEMSLPPEFNP